MNWEPIKIVNCEEDNKEVQVSALVLASGLAVHKTMNPIVYRTYVDPEKTITWMDGFTITHVQSKCRVTSAGSLTLALIMAEKLAEDMDWNADLQEIMCERDKVWKRIVDVNNWERKFITLYAENLDLCIDKAEVEHEANESGTVDRCGEIVRVECID